MDKMPGLKRYHFLDVLERYAEETLKTKDRVLISVVGKNGTGKSYFGRYVRKNGFGRFDKRAVTVIDDRVMTLEFLSLFKKKVKIPRNGTKNIRPFLDNLSDSKKLIFYINNTPAEKIDEADILLKLTTDEETRRKRLMQRYGSEPEKLKKYLDKKETEDYGIRYTYRLEADI